LETSALPVFVSAGDILTDLVRVGGADWVARPGGAGWNVARAVARLGVASACAGAIGEDCFSDELWRQSEVAGLDTRFIQRCGKAPLLAIVHCSDPPDYFFIGNDSADLAFDPQQLPARWESSVRWAHFGGISLARAPLSETLLATAHSLKAQGARISYDPNYRNLMATGYHETLFEMTALADLVKVSDEDLANLFPGQSLDDALAGLRAINFRAAFLLTRGAGQATVYAGDETFSARPPRVDVVDSIGAGDAAIGALLASLIERPDATWTEHLAFALAGGAVACMHSGAYAPTRDEVHTLLAAQPS
jgi:fructokinase